jgi:hypothetical protein
MTRHEIFKASGSTEHFPLWLRPLLREWAELAGFKADLSLSRGVVVRTGAEADRWSISSPEKQDAFTAWLLDRTLNKASKESA